MVHDSNLTDAVWAIVTTARTSVGRGRPPGNAAGSDLPNSPRASLVDRIQHLVPTFDGSDALAGVLGPTEGAWIGARKRLMAACSSTMDRNTPRLSRRLVNWRRSHRGIEP